MENKGQKFDQDKVSVELLPFDSLWETAKVLDFGRKKYSRWNWYKGIQQTRLLSAALRHIFQYLVGIDKDKQSGLCHLAHASCMILFALQFYIENRHDDRNKFQPKVRGGVIDDGYKENTELSEDPSDWPSRFIKSVRRNYRNNREDRWEPNTVWSSRHGAYPPVDNLFEESNSKLGQSSQNVCPSGNSYQVSGTVPKAKLLVHRRNTSKTETQCSKVRECTKKSHCIIFGERR